MVIEALVGGRRVLLSALDQTRNYRCAEEEIGIIERLAQLGEGSLPGMLVLTHASFGGLLPTLTGHERITFGKSVAVKVEKEGIRPRLDLATQEDGSLRLRADADFAPGAARSSGRGEALELTGGSRPLLAGDTAWLLRGSTFSPLAPGLPAIYQDLLIKEVILPPTQAAAFILRELPALRTAFVVELPEGLQGGPPPASPARDEQKPRFAFALEGSLNHLTGKLDAWYGDRPFRIEARRDLASSNKSGVQRNRAAEMAALERLRVAGFSEPDSQGQIILKGEPRILAFFARRIAAPATGVECDDRRAFRLCDARHRAHRAEAGNPQLGRKLVRPASSSARRAASISPPRKSSGCCNPAKAPPG